MALSRRRAVFLSLACLLVTLAVLEVGLRTVDMVRGYGFFSARGNILTEPANKIVPFRTFGFDPYVTIDGETWIRDTWGRQFPLAKPAGTYRIVCFGGSTTANRFGGKHYPALLQKVLRQADDTPNVEVLNVGNSAYATPHSIILLTLDVISWQPDLVILSHNINDMQVMYWPGFRLDYWNKYSHEFYTQPDNTGRRSWNNVLFQHSRLYWFAHHRLSSHNPPATAIRRGTFDQAQLRAGMTVFERNLKTFVTIARANGIDVILGSQPLEPSEDLFLRHMAYKPYNDVVIYPPHDQFLEHHAVYNRVLHEVAQATGVGFVDNEGIFAGNRIYFLDHVHYTEAGLVKLADNYAAAILEKHLPMARQDKPDVSDALPGQHDDPAPPNGHAPTEGPARPDPHDQRSASD